ncbi:unnamed protein product, partial [Orchesella dallaii]
CLLLLLKYNTKMRFTYWNGSNPHRDSLIKVFRAVMTLLRMFLYNPIYLGREYRRFHLEFDDILISILRYMEELDILQEEAIWLDSQHTENAGEDVTDAETMEQSRVYPSSTKILERSRSGSSKSYPSKQSSSKKQITVFFLEDDEQKYNVYGEKVQRNVDSTIAFFHNPIPCIKNISLSEWQKIIDELLEIIQKVSKGHCCKLFIIY